MRWSAGRRIDFPHALHIIQTCFACLFVSMQNSLWKFPLTAFFKSFTYKHSAFMTYRVPVSFWPCKGPDAFITDPPSYQDRRPKKETLQLQISYITCSLRVATYSIKASYGLYLDHQTGIPSGMRRGLFQDVHSIRRDYHSCGTMLEREVSLIGLCRPNHFYGNACRWR